MSIPAAIYARVSSDRQREQETIASQTAALKAYADAHDYAVPPAWVFEDDGYSGTHPGATRAWKPCGISRPRVRSRRCLVYAPDRLSRKYAYQILLSEEFARQRRHGRVSQRAAGKHARGASAAASARDDRRIRARAAAGTDAARQAAQGATVGR